MVKRISTPKQDDRLIHSLHISEEKFERVILSPSEQPLSRNVSYQAGASLAGNDSREALLLESAQSRITKSAYGVCTDKALKNLSKIKGAEGEKIEE